MGSGALGGGREGSGDASPAVLVLFTEAEGALAGAPLLNANSGNCITATVGWLREYMVQACCMSHSCHFTHLRVAYTL